MPSLKESAESLLSILAPANTTKPSTVTLPMAFTEHDVIYNNSSSTFELDEST